MLTYKAINGFAPFYLQELISLKEACKYNLLSDCDKLLLNPVKFNTLTTLGDRSFAAAPPQLWNSLPYAIRGSPSVASFKKALKPFLFQKAFCNFMYFLISFLVGFMQFFYDLSSLGNFYSFSVDIIVLTGFGRFMHFVYLCLEFFLFFEIFLFLSADENSNIQVISALYKFYYYYYTININVDGIK